MKRISTLDKNTLMELYINQSLTSQQVADKIGCSDSFVLKWLHRYDIPVRKKQERVKGLNQGLLSNLYVDQQWSSIRIADYLNCNDETVRQALKRYAIPIRSKSDAGRVKVIKPEERRRLKTHFAKLNLNKMGNEHPAWKGGRYVDNYGYITRRVDGKVIKEHRYVVQEATGKTLQPWEEVNHENGVKTDNRLENLEVIKSLHKYRDWLRRNNKEAKDFPF